MNVGPWSMGLPGPMAEGLAAAENREGSPVEARAMGAKDHWLLAGIPLDQLTPVLEAGREVHFPPGAVIMREGDPPDGIYLLTAGWARITVRNERGEAFLAHVKANEVLGEMGILEGEPRSGSVTAITECVSYFLPAEPFLQLLGESNQVANRLLLLFSQRLRQANRMIMGLAAAGPVSRRNVPIAP